MTTRRLIHPPDPSRGLLIKVLIMKTQNKMLKPLLGGGIVLFVLLFFFFLKYSIKGLNGNNSGEFFMGLCTLGGASLVIVAAWIQARGNDRQITAEDKQQKRKEDLAYLGLITALHYKIDQESLKCSSIDAFSKVREIFLQELEKLPILIQPDFVTQFVTQVEILHLFARLPDEAQKKLYERHVHIALLKISITSYKSSTVSFDTLKKNFENFFSSTLNLQKIIGLHRADFSKKVPPTDAPNAP